MVRAAEMRQEENFVIGIDLSLTAPGLARISRPWGDEAPHAVATTLNRVPTTEYRRGLVLMTVARTIGGRVLNLAMGDTHTPVVMEALLLQSGTGKAPERAAFWWMVRADLEARGFDVYEVHPTSRRSIAMDAEARDRYNAAPKRRRGVVGKQVALASMKRRWPGVVLPDDNSADALVCAEVGAHAAGFSNMPPLTTAAQRKSLTNAVSRFETRNENGG